MLKFSSKKRIHASKKHFFLFSTRTRTRGFQDFRTRTRGFQEAEFPQYTAKMNPYQLNWLNVLYSRRFGVQIHFKTPKPQYLDKCW
jgi:hypothetical protein